MEIIPIKVLAGRSYPQDPNNPNYYPIKGQTNPEQLLAALESLEMQAHLQANPAFAEQIIKAAGGSEFRQNLANFGPNQSAK